MSSCSSARPNTPPALELSMRPRKIWHASEQAPGVSITFWIGIRSPTARPASSTVSRRIVHQHAARLATLEHLAADLAADTTVVQRVAEEVADDFEVALERNLVADEFRLLLTHHATPS